MSLTFTRFVRFVAVLLCGFAPLSMAATISGTVFEDVNYGGGAGRSLTASGGVGIPNARVEIYDGAGNYQTFVTTNASGVYTYTYGGNTSRIVRVVNGTLRSTRSGGSTCTTCVPVQTFRTTGSADTASAVTNRVGGENPALNDAASNTSSVTLTSLTTSTRTAQSVATFDPVGNSSTISNADFGFNFDTVVDTGDSSNCAATDSGTHFPCQGTLRQFIINSNALGGEGSLGQSGSGQIDGSTQPLPFGSESSIFMIPSAALTSNVAVITLAGALPTVTGSNTRLDATTQTVNIGDTNPGSEGSGGTVGVDAISLPTIRRPEVQLNCAASNAQLTLSGVSDSILGFALRQGYILLSGMSGTARNNLVGMTATGSSADASSAFYGIMFSAANATISNNYVTVNDSGIRSDGGGSGSVITLNEVARPSSGHTNTFDGILLINGATAIQITANLVRNQAGGAIELGFGAASDSYSSVTVSNNTVRDNGYTSGTTASSEPIGMVSYNYVGSGVVYSRNRVFDNAGPGLLIMGASGTSATQNSFSNNGGISIDLDPNTRDPNALGAPNGVTLNDNNDADTGPNGLLNYPVITSAIIANGELSIAGFARPGSAIELYRALADATGFGEGQTYVTAVTENGAADLDGTSGTYGPAAINGRAQGTDTTSRFAFRMALPAGISIGSVLTATATIGGQTSEFGGNVTVTGGPSLTHTKTVAVESDPVNNTINPKNIPGAIEVYTVRVTNQGSGIVDNDSVQIVDAIPANTVMCGLGGTPVSFANGTPVSGLTLTFSALNSTTDDVDFSNTTSGVPIWTYTPTATAGCDANVHYLRVRPRGTMAGANASGNPYFEIQFRVKVQ